MTVLLTATSAVGVSAADRVKTANGVVEGTTARSGIRIFRGIPFAAPPVGDLRWKPPQPVKSWDGVREAKAFAAPPIQKSFLEDVFGPPKNQSEDCLYLNVWTPAKAAAEPLPVMVWIYGGAFVSGDTSFPLFEGTRLAEKGVVVVSVAYRVGPLGFLAHPELSREGGGVSGNYGLRDQIAGLQWVRNNIAAFGGDPARVTIFGESAGGISVSMLAATPKAKGLFQRAISQSGGSFAPPKFDQEGGQKVRPLSVAEAEGKRYFATLGAKDLAAARALPAADLLKVGGDWWPVCDGEVLPGDQYELYQAGRFNDTPILVGTNSDEGALFFRPGVTPKAFVAQIRAGFGDHADAILATYPHATPAEAFKASKDIFRDSALAWHTWTWARLQSEKGKGKAFVYYFDHRTPQSPDGANHGADLVYVFGHLGLPGRPPRPEDVALSERMRTYWVNFTRTGDPNGKGLPEWSSFTAANPKVMYFDGSPGMRPVPNLKQLKALDAYYAWRREQAKEKR
jgi:para-nitrobenzyl esterase